MNTSKKIISLLMCMLMVLSIVPMSVFATVGPTEIDTINIEGVPTPVYGQTIKSYYEAIEAKITDGTITVNDEVYDSANYKYGNLLDDAWNVRDEDDFYLSSTSTESIKEGTYYVAMWFLPDNGYVIPEDVNVLFDGAKSVKIEVEDDGCLDIHAEYEVKATEIDAVNLTYDLDYIDLNTFYNENSVTARAREALATDTAGIKISYGNCCVSYIDSNGDFYNCTYPSKEIIAEKDYYIRAVLMLEDGYDWPTAAKTDEPSGLKIISNGTDISDTVCIKYRSDLNWIIIYAKIGKPSTEPVIGGVSISDSAIMLDKGESHSFIVDVYGNADDKTVTWTVEGAVSANTTVDSMGKLTIGADETADEITVKATSNYNSKKFVAAKVKIGTPTEIDTVHIEGVPAPVYGQTIKSYYEAIEAKITDGTITVNDGVYDSTAYKYGNLFDDGWNVRSEADGYLSTTSTDLIKEGTYYVAMWFYPDNGYVIPEDVNVIFDGAKSVKIEVEDDGCLDIRAEYEFEAPAPTEIDTVHIEGIPAPLYGQTVEEYYTAILDERGGGTLTVNDEAFDKMIGKYGNLFDEGLEVKKNDTGLDPTSTELITEGNYYVAMTLYPADGYVIPADVAVTVDGAASVETDFDEYGSLIVYAKYEVKATKIDTINIEGVLAPQYGDTVQDHFDDMIKKGDDGEFKVNGLGYYVCDLFDDMGFSLLDKDKKRLDKSEVIVEGIYYFAMGFLPSDGYVIPNGVAVTLDGALSVETEFDEDGWLTVWAKFEVECPHTYDNACDAECNNCPATRTPAAHTGGTATCTDKAKCSVCGEAYGSVNKDNHKSLTTLKAEAATCTKEGKTEGKKCTACGTVTVAQKIIAKKAHNEIKVSGKSATCTKTGLTEGKKCADCGTVTVARQTIKAMGHKYTNACDTSCNTCKATRKITHTYKNVTTKATLTNNGKVVNKCTVCGNVSKTTIVYYPKTIKLSYTSTTYNGKTKKPTVTVKDSKGKTLKKDTDYTVKYAKGRKAIGKYTVTVTFKGKYSGTKKLSFTIKPKAVTLSKVTAGSKQLTANWKTVAAVTGYEVQASTSSKFTSKTTKKVTIKKAKTTKTTIKKLKKGKKYYVKVRAYKTVGKTKIYSAWSSVKTVKVK